MTEREAIKYLNLLFSDSTDEEYCGTEVFAEAVKLGVEALEKHIEEAHNAKSNVRTKDWRNTYHSRV